MSGYGDCTKGRGLRRDPDRLWAGKQSLRRCFWRGWGGRLECLNALPKVSLRCRGRSAVDLANFTVCCMRLGWLGDVATKVCSDARLRWFNADWQQLLAIDWAAGSVSGGCEVGFFHPSADLLKRNGCQGQKRQKWALGLFFNAEAVAVRQMHEHLTVTIRDTKTSTSRDVTARYLIGIDDAEFRRSRDALGIKRQDLALRQIGW